MKRFLNNLVSYLIFVITVSIVVSLGIIIYSNIRDFPLGILALLVLIYILFAGLVFYIIDYVRRNVFINKPLNDILDATYLISKGQFDINLKPRHDLSNYDELDMIMVNINKMVNALRNEEILRNDFISNFSHEVKTPIAVIDGYINLLKKRDIKDKDKEMYLDKLAISVSNLSNLVSNILKLNKLENEEEIEKENVNLVSILENVIVSFDELLVNKNINLDIDICDKADIISNQSIIQIIFSNLISNAIKFSKDNSIIVIKLLKNDNNYKFIVKDNGIGMTKDTINNIFNRFYQADTSHKSEGNGLGLSMVKKGIDRLGYKISIESEEGIGSTFVVDIK